MNLEKIIQHYVISLVLIINSMAMEEEKLIINNHCNDHIEKNLTQFNALSPSQKQIWYLLSWAHYPHDFSQEKMIKNSGVNFHYQSPPQKLVRFINYMLPAFFSAKADILTFDQLDINQLYSVIVQSIDQGLPLAIYCFNTNRCYLTTIIGYNKNNNDLLFLNEDLKIEEMSADELLLKANLTHIRSLLKTSRPDLVNSLSNNDNDLLQNFKEQLHNFTLLVFNYSLLACPIQ